MFRLALKFLGVWLVATGIAPLMGSAFMYVGYLFATFGFGDMYYEPGFWLSLPAQHLAQVGVGLYLFFGGRWIVDKAIPGNRPYCHECGYDLRHCGSNCCPECGTEFKPAN
jgi:hypothetical protein